MYYFLQFLKSDTVSGGAWTFYLEGLTFIWGLTNNFYLIIYNSKISFVITYLLNLYLIWTEIYFVDIICVYRVDTCMRSAGP